MDGRIDRRMDGWTNGQTDEQMNEQTNERKSPCVLQDFVPFGAAAQKPQGLN